MPSPHVQTTAATTNATAPATTRAAAAATAKGETEMLTDTRPDTGFAQHAATTGWVDFAAFMAFIGGAFNVTGGLIALARASYFNVTSLLIANLTFWGWLALAWGAALLVTGGLLMARSNVGRWMGLVLASVSALMWFLLVPAAPLWALTIIAVDVLIIYGLAASREVFE